VGRVAPPPANLVISNVPGAKETMYLNGARLLGTYAVPAIAASVGLNVTVSSYADSMDFGFGANGATMYRLPDLARHVADAYEELKAAARGGARSGRHSRNPRRTKQPRATAAARSRKGG
jgi:hypothetical protein